jgi:hypothetical protein
LEVLVLTALRQHLQNRAERHDLMATPDAKHAATLSEALGGLLASKGDAALWPLIAEINLTKGSPRNTLAAEELATAFNIPP